MKRAIVTGASGFVGSHLVKELLQNGYEVLATAHTESGLKTMEGLGSQNLQTVICDIPDLAPLCKAASGEYDVFFHMAWAGVSGPMNRSIEAQKKNVEGAVRAIEVARELRCKRFLGAGSIHEIECVKEMEQPEPINNYANYYKSSKLTAHYYCKLKATELGIDFLWPRLTNTYGVGEHSVRLLNTVIRQLLRGESPALTDATQLYNFIYVTDAARGYRMIAENGKAFQNYILGSEEVRPLREYMLTVQSVVNPEVTLGFGMTPFRGIALEHGDLRSDSFFDDTGFSTQVTFEEGIRRTRDYLKTGEM